jgi:hypothetical protein
MMIAPDCKLSQNNLLIREKDGVHYFKFNNYNF